LVMLPLQVASSPSSAAMRMLPFAPGTGGGSVTHAVAPPAPEVPPAPALPPLAAPLDVAVALVSVSAPLLFTPPAPALSLEPPPHAKRAQRKGLPSARNRNAHREAGGS